MGFRIIERTETFGNGRYFVEKVETRFGDVQFFTLDSETPDPAFPGIVMDSIIRQESTLEGALRGLGIDADSLTFSRVLTPGREI